LREGTEYLGGLRLSRQTSKTGLGTGAQSERAGDLEGMRRDFHHLKQARQMSDGGILPLVCGERDKGGGSWIGETVTEETCSPWGGKAGLGLFGLKSNAELEAREVPKGDGVEGGEKEYIRKK